MASFTFRPLTAWPGPQRKAYQQKRSLFDSTYGQTMDLLKRELDALWATGCVISLDLEERDITRDGTPRSTARPKHPGVVLYFEKPNVDGHGPHQPMSFPCDRFDRWEDNLRAIALSLEALRKVDRYGVTSRGEQYTGFRALPAQTSATLSVKQATDVLTDASGLHVPTEGLSATVFENVRRVALKRAHPDTGGDAARFSLVQDAIRKLATHYGWAA